MRYAAAAICASALGGIVAVFGVERGAPIAIVSFGLAIIGGLFLRARLPGLTATPALIAMAILVPLTIWAGVK